MATHIISAPGTRPEGIGRTRREAIGALGFTGLAGLAAAGFAAPDKGGLHYGHPSADAQLLALIEQFNELERTINATFVGDHATGSPEDFAAEARRDELGALQDPLFAKITALRATTLEGFRARARMLNLWDPQLGARGAPDGYWPDQLAAVLVRDLIAEG